MIETHAAMLDVREDTLCSCANVPLNNQGVVTVLGFGNN